MPRDCAADDQGAGGVWSLTRSCSKLVTRRVDATKTLKKLPAQAELG